MASKPKSARSQQTREHLLDAAETVVKQAGVPHLTLDAVATMAGVSKGGVLYHFASKQALIAAMLERLFAHLRADHAQLLLAEPAGPGRWLRAYVRGAFAQVPERDLSSALLAGLAHEPELLAVARQEYAHWQAEALADGLDPTLSLVILLAADGYWFSALCEAQPLPPEQAQAVMARLLALIGGTP